MSLSHKELIDLEVSCHCSFVEVQTARFGVFFFETVPYSPRCVDLKILGGGFKYVFFHPDPWGNDPI